MLSLQVREVDNRKSSDNISIVVAAFDHIAANLSPMPGLSFSESLKVCRNFRLAQKFRTDRLFLQRTSEGLGATFASIFGSAQATPAPDNQPKPSGVVIASEDSVSSRPVEAEGLRQ